MQISLDLDEYKGSFSAYAPGAFIRHYTVADTALAGCKMLPRQSSIPKIQNSGVGGLG